MNPNDGDESNGSDPSDLDVIARVANVGEVFPLHKVPTNVADALDSIWDREHGSATESTEYLEALLIHDSRIDRPLVGLRSYDVHGEWSVSFRAPSVDVVVDCMSQPDGSTLAVGQFLPALDTLEPLLVSATGPTSVEVTTDELGQFEMAGLESGSYDVRAENRTIRVRFRLDIDQVRR